MWWRWGTPSWGESERVISGNDQLHRGRGVSEFCLFLSVCMSGLFDGVKVSA